MMIQKKSAFWLLLALIAPSLPACNDVAADVSAPPDSSKVDPLNPSGGSRSPTTHVLLFNGTGVSTSDWQATELLVRNRGWSYRLVNSAELNAMSLVELTTFGVIVVPGGKGGTITASLSQAARLRVRQAVRDYGVGYVGFCAGAWIAVGPEADGDSVASYGLAVASGPVLPSYYPGGNSNLTAAMVPIRLATGTTRHLVWWGGPSTPEWSGGVVGRYSTGEPAISQRWSGRGLVVISGPHPEAPWSWRSTAGTDPDGPDNELAIAMIDAALGRNPLPTL